MKTMMLAAGVLAAVMLSGCSSSTGSTATPARRPGPATATSTTVAESACTSLGGTVGGDQTCRVHSDTARYTLDFRFPVDYPDQQALTDAVTQERDGFVDWASGLPPQSFPYELDIIGKAYRSRTPAAGTQSLVFDVGTSGGVHPVTTYRALNYDLSKHAPDHARHFVQTRHPTDGGAQPNCPARVGQTRGDGLADAR